MEIIENKTHKTNQTQNHPTGDTGDTRESSRNKNLNDSNTNTQISAQTNTQTNTQISVQTSTQISAQTPNNQSIPQQLFAEDIMEILPHRYPMLLVDRVLEVNAHTIHTIKNVTINEDFFNGHFPGHYVMPGVLIVEAMAQSAILLVANELGKEMLKTHVAYFSSIENARFHKTVLPGDQLHIKVTKIRSKMGIWKMNCIATVNEQKVSSAAISAALAQKNKRK